MTDSSRYQSTVRPPATEIGRWDNSRACIPLHDVPDALYEPAAHAILPTRHRGGPATDHALRQSIDSSEQTARRECAVVPVHASVVPVPEDE